MLLHQKLGAVTVLAAMVVATGPALANAADLSRDERRARRLVNVARTNNDLDALRADRHLSSLARKHSRKMAAEDELFHRADLTAGLTNLSWSLVGENVGYGDSVKQVHGAFMDSAPHRHNILGSGFDEVGVGVVERDGRSWVTLIFLG